MDLFASATLVDLSNGKKTQKNNNLYASHTRQWERRTQKLPLHEQPPLTGGVKIADHLFSEQLSSDFLGPDNLEEN